MSLRVTKINRYLGCAGACCLSPSDCLMLSQASCSAIGGILDMIHNVEEKAPLRRTVTQTEVGNTAAFLLSDLSSGISGQTIYVDAGYCINGM